MPAFRSALVLAAAAPLLAGCAVAAVARPGPRDAAGFAPCPERVPARLGAPGRFSEPAPAPPGATGLQLCVYRVPIRKPATSAVLARTAIMSRAQARTFTRLIDSGGGDRWSCDDGDPALVRLRYAGGRTRSLLAAGCAPELVRTPTGVRRLSSTASFAVGGLAQPPLIRSDPVTATFDYLGRRLAIAVREAHRNFPGAGSAAVFDYELDDPTVPFGRVVWQRPLAGTAQDALVGEVELVVAVHPAKACRADQLEGRYRNGGNATESHFGSIDLLDVSGRPCTLEGRLELTGLDAAGRPATDTVSGRIAPGVVLSPGATVTTLDRDPAAALIAGVYFSGNAAGANGLCYRHETIPVAWSLMLAGAGAAAALRIENGGPGAGGSFFSCRGSLSFGLTPGLGLLAG